MRVAELHIDGFGRLVNGHYRFAPGFNLIFGPNEAGKSSLQQAILALLYGVAADGPASASEQALMEALRPWDEAAPYAGSLTYVLDDGQAFRASRRFLPRPEATLRTHPEGKDVSQRFKRAPQGRLHFAVDHLGLDRAVFESICVVRQPGLASLESSATAATEALTRLLASATPDAATQSALERLETALREQVGAQQDGSEPLPLAMARLTALEAERERVLQARPELFSRFGALQEAGRRVEALALEREQLLALQARAEQAAKRRQVVGADEAASEVRRCEAEVANWQAWVAFPAQLRDDVLRMTAQRVHLREECAAAERRAAQAQETLQALQTQEAVVKERLVTLGGTQAPATDQFYRIQTLASEWTAASEFESFAAERREAARAALEALERRLAEEGKPLETVIPLGGAGLAAAQQRLQGARERLAQAKGLLREANTLWTQTGVDEAEFQAMQTTVEGASPATEPVPPGRPLLSRILGRPGRAGRAPADRPVQNRLRPVYANLVRCRGEVEAVQLALSDTEATILWQMGRLLGGTLDESAFAQLGEKLERYLQAAAQLDQQRITVAGLHSELDQARERREGAHRALQAALTKLGFDTDDTHKALAAYMKRQAQRDHFSHEEAEQERSRLRAEADLELLRLRAGVLQGEISYWRDRQAALAAAETQLVALLAQAGITCTANTLEDALEAFDEGCENHGRWEKAQAGLDMATRYHRALLGAARAGSEPPPKGRGSRARGKDGEREPAPDAEAEKSPQEYAALLQQLDDELASADEQHRRLQAAVEQASSLRHLAEIDEELAAARADLRRLERFREALQLASDELGRAAQEFQKQFSLRLELLLNQGLSGLTEGRYVAVKVDPDSLALAVRAPGREALVPAECLSAGTRDLVYLLLRLGIARLLGQSKERLPLLLDEPLGQCDQGRRQQAFDFLVQLAGSMQVLYFTRDERLKARFEEQYAKSPLHQLHVLA